MCQTRNSRGGLFGVLFSIYDTIKMKWDGFTDRPNGESREQNSPRVLLGLYQFDDFYLFMRSHHFHRPRFFGQSSSCYGLHSALSRVEAGKHGGKKKPATARNPCQDLREMLRRRPSKQWVCCVKEKFSKDKVAAVSPQSATGQK